MTDHPADLDALAKAMNQAKDLAGDPCEAPYFAVMDMLDNDTISIPDHYLRLLESAGDHDILTTDSDYNDLLDALDAHSPLIH